MIPLPQDGCTVLFGPNGSGKSALLSLICADNPQAYACDPELLILDEPMHGLDDINRRRVQDIIGAFCDRPGKTLVMVSHYEDDFPPCIDHRLTLKRP